MRQRTALQKKEIAALKSNCASSKRAVASRDHSCFTLKPPRGTSTIDGSILWPLLVSALGFSLLFGAIVLMRMRAELARNKVEARLKRMAAE